MTVHAMPSPLRYDLMLWIASRGRERDFRERQLNLARIAPGEAVLDVGCGTGTLAIAAARRVGDQGTMQGVDPSPELVARARKKARRAGVDVAFTVARGEQLPVADSSFDVVLSTLVFHHLSHDALRASVAEIRRVLKPGGRLLAVDIGGPQDDKRTMHGPRGHRVAFDLAEIASRLPRLGLEEIESGPVESGIKGLENLRYVLAEAAH
jgi:ubiquinone/menaquinone biosynthesis C-methylase UbiE